VDGGDGFEVEVGDVEDVFAAKGEFVGSDDDLPDVAAWL
jgi:hypothetical protein